MVAMVYCETCECRIPGGLEDFKEHIKKEQHRPPFICGNGACHTNPRLYHVKSSFVRHLEDHSELSDSSGDESSTAGSAGWNEPTSPVIIQNDNASHSDGDSDVNMDANEAGSDSSYNTNDSTNDFSAQLQLAAARLVLQLWRHGNVPGVAISHVIIESTKLIESVVSATLNTVASNLSEADVSEETIINCVRNVSFIDPFWKLKGMKQQLETFKELFNLVKPEPKPLGWRMDDRIDRHSGLTLPIQVPVNCQYVSLIETLTVVLNNPVLFRLIHSEKPSSDGILRSYLDGSLCSDHPLLSKYPQTIRLVKWIDDSEVVNAQGAKTCVHKVTSDCYLIQNLPHEENSRLRSIHLSSYAYREDMPEGRGTDAVLEPFFEELGQLETEDGVTIPVNGEPYTLRATLIAFAADTLSGHELLGLCGPSANRICSQCLVYKQELYRNILSMGKERSKAMHMENIQELHSKGQKFAILSSGLKRVSTLVEKSTHAEFPEAMIKDPMHDILRGIAPMEIKLVLHEYVVVKKYFQIEDFNAALKSFNYGQDDMKNRPSPNFTLDSLQKPVSYVLHQSAAQTWCLLRVFPFIISSMNKVPQNCPHLNMLVLLKRVCDHVFSTAISHEDLNLMDQLTKEHHLQFQSLYPPPETSQTQNQGNAGATADDEDDPDEDFLVQEQQEDDPAPVGPEAAQRKQKKAPKVVRPLFKHHYTLHYKVIIEKFGPIILYWCMRFEAKNALLKRYGAICNNFQNLPLSFANLHQIVHAADLMDLSTAVRDEVNFTGAKPCVAKVAPEFHALSAVGILENDVLQQVKTLSTGGFHFRIGLYLALPITINSFPVFGKICGLYLHDSSPYVVTEDVTTLCYDTNFAAYRIEAVEHPTVRTILPTSLPPVRPISPWIANNRTYLSPRNLIADLYINREPDD